MAKVTIDGEVFEFNPDRQPLAECLIVERALKVPYAQVEEGLKEGRADSVAAFIWMVWHRNGRDVSLADLLAGNVDVDLGAVSIEREEGEADPTNPTLDPLKPTGESTSVSSLSDSGSGPGSSASSTPASSSP